MYWTVLEGVHTYEWVTETSGQILGHPACLTTTIRATGTDVDAAIKAAYGKMGEYTWAKSDFVPGEMYPRIWRTDGEPDRGSAAYESSVASARNLSRRLDDIFRVVEPDDRNLGVFGHELRHVLILACTEVESGLKAVLKANNVRPTRRNYELPDYWKLVAPMKLDHWSAVINHRAHHCSKLEPFKGWTKNSPPAWWTAYNRVKHDREANLVEATLGHALNALAGVWVVIGAQFGTAELPEHVSFGNIPHWGASERYIPPSVPGGHATWTPKTLVV